MDRSYRLKMEELLKNRILTKEYIINCIAKYEEKIDQLAYKEKQYRNASYNKFRLQLDELTRYRKPFIDVLIKEYRMSLDDINSSLCKVKEKNIPTKQICDYVRTLVISGDYILY